MLHQVWKIQHVHAPQSVRLSWQTGPQQIHQLLRRSLKTAELIKAEITNHLPQASQKQLHKQPLQS